MKKIIITLSFIAILQTAFAQTKAEKMFQQTMNDYQTNPLKAVSENLSDDYVLMSGSGYMANKSQVVAIFKNVKSIDVTFKDLKVRQVGNIVIATGKEHDVRHHSDGTPDLVQDYLSTYVYEIKGNKLMGLSGQHTYPTLGSPQADEESIKNMLRQETIDVYAGKDVSGSFVDSPKTFRGWNTRTGYSVKNGIADIRKENDATFGYRPRDMKPINENFTFKYYGNDAVMVTYDQYLYGKEQAPSKEMRMLEKVNGQWKIAGLMALWDYSDNAFEKGNVRKTIDAETNAYHAGDVAALEKQWAFNTAYVERQQTYLKTIGAAPYLKGDALRAFSEQFKKVHKPTGLTSEISDYEVHVGTTNAWATYTQESFDASGKLVNKSRELRILERIDGWKIVAMSNVEM
jgi:hypothetical protein